MITCSQHIHLLDYVRLHWRKFLIAIIGILALAASHPPT